MAKKSASLKTLEKYANWKRNMGKFELVMVTASPYEYLKRKSAISRKVFQTFHFIK